MSKRTSQIVQKRDIMYDVWDIYCILRRTEAHNKNRGYRLPKNWNVYWENRLSPSAREAYKKITDYFNTKWCDISPEKYFEAGFSTFKNFSHRQFFDRKVIKKYKENDRKIKRDNITTKKDIIDSVKYMMTQIVGYTENPFKYYCNLKHTEYTSKPVKDYINNYISASFLVWLIKNGWLTLQDEERSLLPYITSNYFSISGELSLISEFTEEIKRKIMKKYSGKPLTSKSLSGNLLFGTETETEKKEKNNEYSKKQLNE